MINNTPKWPYQKRSTASKGKKFCIQSLEAAENMYSELSNVTDIQAITQNEALIHGKLDPASIEHIVNPLGLKASTFKPPVQSYPLCRDKVDLLSGEEWKRKFDFMARLVNPEAIREKHAKKAQLVYDFLAKMIVEDSSLEENDKKKKLQKFNKSVKSWKDLREKRANRILDMEYRTLDMKEKFNKGFNNLIVKRNEIYAIDIANGKTDFRVVDLENIKAIRLGGSKRLDDADIIIEETYESPGWVIDRYYNKLTSKQVEAIDQGFSDGDYGGNFGYETAGDLLNFAKSDTFGETEVNIIDNPNASNELINLDSLNNGTSGYRDEHGNVRVTRMVWRSLRKLGTITWIDENGEKQEKTVDEYYKPREELGEEVEWNWVTEYWRIVRIGKDIYPEWGPRPVQFRTRDNIGSAGSGYVGNVLETCLVDLMKPFQIMYDVIMERTKHAFLTSRGKVAVMDMARKPKSWNHHQWYHYLDVFNVMYEDSFSEGKRGVAQGKIAGNMQQTNRSLDLENGQYIQQHLLMLQYIEQRIGDIAGIPKAREGQSSSNETATGVQNSVTQSYHITEPYFAIHESIKNRALEYVLENTKYCIRQNPDLYEYYLDEEDLLVGDLGMDDFLESSLGIDVTSSGEDVALLNQYKQLAHAFIQNDKMKLSTLASIYESKSISDIRNKIEDTEDEMDQKMAEMEEQRNKIEQAKITEAKELEQAKRDHEAAMNDSDNRTDIMEKLIDLDKAKLDADIKSEAAFEKLQENYDKLVSELQIKEREAGLKERDLDIKEKDLQEKRRLKDNS